jgi:AraC-like DNA-binding protein
MAEDTANKTEEPTPRRREEARTEGQIPQSAEITAAAVLLTAVVVVTNRGPAMVETLREMMRRNLLRRRVTNAVPDRFEIETLSLELLSVCLRALRSGSVPLQPAVRFRRMRAVERVKEAVGVAPADPWSIVRLASIANLSAFHLCHVFHELVGTSIYDYVVRERLAQGLNAVLDSGDDITAIALDAGFANHSHFTARFRRFFGCTPSALRRGANAGQVGQLRKIMTARANGHA